MGRPESQPARTPLAASSQLASLLRHATDAALQVATDDLRVLDANAAACRLLDAARDDLVGRPLPELLGGGANALREALDAVRQVGDAHGTLAVRQSGRARDLDVHAVSLDTATAIVLLVDRGADDRVQDVGGGVAARLAHAERICAAALADVDSDHPAAQAIREARAAAARAAALLRSSQAPGARGGTPTEAEARAMAASAPAPLGADDQERPVVLFVDDEATLRSLGRRILERHGFSVLEASTGRDALDVARAADHINLLVTDLSMPGMNGSELADRLVREHDRLGVLFLSGGGVHELERVAGARRTFTFLEKPFAPSSLVHKLRELLSRAK